MKFENKNRLLAGMVFQSVGPSVVFIYVAQMHHCG